MKIGKGLQSSQFFLNVYRGALAQSVSQALLMLQARVRIQADPGEDDFYRSSSDFRLFFELYTGV